jgi:uncharacterized membrane protein YkvA (DUF1232 family)
MNMAKTIEQMFEWMRSLHEDAATLKEFVAAQAAPAEARALGAGALNYLITRLDIVPDWEPTCGVLDDAIVLRVAVAQASEKDLGALPAQLLAALGRLANEADLVPELLGRDMHGKLSRYVRDLAKREVRKRFPSQIVSDEKLRAQLFDEVEQELRAHPAPKPGDPTKTERVLKSYFEAKLKNA